MPTLTLEVTEPTEAEPMSLEWFRSQRVIEPDLCHSTSWAVGFPVSIYWLRWPWTPESGTRYQVMPWIGTDSHPRVRPFWRWYLDRPQWYRTPALAAAKFVQGHREWAAFAGEPGGDGFGA